VPLLVVEPPDVAPVPPDVPVAAGLSELMLPPRIVLSGVDDEVELLCAIATVPVPSKEMNTAIVSFFMLPPNNVTN